MQSSWEYDIFVSFNHADKSFTDKLVEKLDKEEIGGSRLKVFYSERDILEGGNMVTTLDDAMEKSRFAVLVMTPNYLRSDWTKMERSFFVYRDPAGMQARLIPLLVEDCTVPPSIRFLKWIDFTIANGFARGYRKLINRLEGGIMGVGLDHADMRKPQASSLSHLPDLQKEKVVSNLFELFSLPGDCYAVSAKVEKRNEVWSILEGKDLPPFAFDESQRIIISFANPMENGLREVSVPGTDRQISKNELFDMRNNKTATDLLNRCITRHVQSIGLTYDFNLKKNFFQPSDRESIRYHKTKPKSKHPGRILFKQIGNNLDSYYAHRMCRTTFTRIGESYFLKMIPGWHFTVDGKNAVSNDRMNSLTSKWMNVERNRAVFLDIRLWSEIFSHDSDNITIDTTNGDIEVFSTPNMTELDVGILEDYNDKPWQESVEDDDSLSIDNALSSLESEDDQIP